MPGRRSRSCQACLRRKIKCGLQVPQCFQCLTSKLECSGPVLGPIIVHVDPRTQSRRSQSSPNKKSGEHQQSHSSEESVDDEPLAQPASNTDLQLYSLFDRHVMHYAIDMKFKDCIYIPHQRYRSFVSTLVDTPDSDKLPIVQHTLSTCSVTMAGIIKNDVAMVREGQKLYGALLKRINKEIAGYSESGGLSVAPKRGHGLDTGVMAAVAGSVWFEAIQCTHPDGWINHSFGAVQLILTKDPSTYTTGFAHDVFRTIRYMSVNASLSTIQPTPFVLDLWQDKPFSLKGKSTFDKLLDIVLLLPVYLSSLDKLLAAGLPLAWNVEVEAIGKQVLALEQQLNDWWVSHRESIFCIAHLPAHQVGEHFGGYPVITNSREEPKFRSEEAAECFVYFELSQMLVALMKAPQPGHSSNMSNCRAQALAHSESLLTAIAYFDAKTTTGGLREYFGLVCPLLIVSLASPSYTQRRFAEVRMEHSAAPFAFQRICGFSSLRSFERWRHLSAVWGPLSVESEQQSITTVV